MCGVFRYGWPDAPVSSKRRSSTRITIRLGFTALLPADNGHFLMAQCLHDAPRHHHPPRRAARRAGHRDDVARLHRVGPGLEIRRGARAARDARPRDAGGGGLRRRRKPAPRAARWHGFAIMEFGDERAHLVLLAVRPSHRRLGIGQRMLDWLLESARVAGMASIHLELRAGNDAARRFYRAMGFYETVLVPGYYRSGEGRKEGALRMLRVLRSPGPVPYTWRPPKTEDTRVAHGTIAKPMRSCDLLPHVVIQDVLAVAGEKLQVQVAAHRAESSCRACGATGRAARCPCRRCRSAPRRGDPVAPGVVAHAPVDVAAVVVDVGVLVLVEVAVDLRRELKLPPSASCQCHSGRTKAMLIERERVALRRRSTRAPCPGARRRSKRARRRAPISRTATAGSSCRGTPSTRSDRSHSEFCV